MISNPNCIYGWWEEQLLAETEPGVIAKPMPCASIMEMKSWMLCCAAVDPAHLRWFNSLQFGFVELDCGLIHGSSADIGDELTPKPRR